MGIGVSLLTTYFIHLSQGDKEIASLVEARNVGWAEGQPPIAVNTRLKTQTIRCLSGVLRVAFDSGAVATLEGQTDLRLPSDTRLRVIRGRITTRVDAPLKGFSIETPSTVVVDQGTEFGVEVDSSGQTGVVVFEGLVDLSRPKSTENPTAIRRLSQGEGMRIGRTGHLSRIVAVKRRHGDDKWSTKRSSSQDAVILSVSDNIRAIDSSKYYQIVPHGLSDDQPAYVDRPHQWNGLDASGLADFLRGADYIMTLTTISGSRIWRSRSNWHRRRRSTFSSMTARKCPPGSQSSSRTPASTSAWTKHSGLRLPVPARSTRGPAEASTTFSRYGSATSIGPPRSGSVASVEELPAGQCTGSQPSPGKAAHTSK